MEDYEELPAEVSRGRLGLIAVIIVGGTMVLVGIIAIILSSFSSAPERPIAAIARSESAPPHQIEKTSRPSEAAYPYAECAAIVDDLKKNAGDPESLQIIEWGKREEREVGTKILYDAKHRPIGYDPKFGISQAITIMVSFRAKTAFGGYAVSTREYGFQNGKMTGSQPR